MLNYLHVDHELLVNPPAMRARPPSVHQAAAPSQSLLSALVEGVEPEPVRELVKCIFTDLTRLIGYLGWIGDDLCQDESLDETLPKFMLVQGEALFLVNFINTQASHLEGLPEAAREALDGISYVIGHELHRVFEDNLKGLHELQQHSLVRSRVEHAHGILSNCFQQSTIVLAQVFDPTLDGARLFNDAQVRQEQSLLLYHDLSTLAQLVRSAERSVDQHLRDLLIEGLMDFQGGSMRYLMFRDWEFYERFVEQLIESRDTTEFTGVLHRLDCYLEMLHAHVRMRAVLADYSADCVHTENEH